MNPYPSVGQPSIGLFYKLTPNISAFQTYPHFFFVGILLVTKLVNNLYTNILINVGKVNEFGDCSYVGI